MTGAGLRRVLISSKLLGELLGTGKSIPAGTIAAGLPAGARLVSASLLKPGSEGEADLVLLFEHESFEPWHPTVGPAPEHRIDFVADSGPVSALRALLAELPELWGDRVTGGRFMLEVTEEAVFAALDAIKAARR